MHEGSGNAIELLTADHRKVEKLFEEFERASDGEKQQELADDILTELTAHAETEEKTFYPEAMKTVSVDIKEMIEHGIGEHGKMKLLIEEIRDSRFKDGYVAQMKQLKSIVKEHVQEEEGNVFPDAEMTIPKEKLKSLARTMMGQKMAILGVEKFREIGR